MLEISTLEPCEYNPRRISPTGLDLLANSISKHTMALDGWDPTNGYRLTTTITVNRNGNRIIGGHQRIVALRDILGQPWIHDGDITWVRLEPGSPQEKALNLALNARDAQGDFEWQGVSDLLQELNNGGEGLEWTGFGPETIQPLLGASWEPPAIDQNAENTRGGDSDEWYTPANYVELARKVLHQIDLDPASCAEAQRTVKAAEWFDRERDGLKQEWPGRVWLNPPYSMPLIKKFIAKLIDEHESGRTTAAVCLVNNATDTSWFQSLLTRYPACFAAGRISFDHPGRESDANRQGQAFFYLGPDTKRFADAFGAVGTIVMANAIA